MYFTLVVFIFDNDFEWAFSFHSGANLHNPLILFALSFSHTFDGFFGSSHVQSQTPFFSINKIRSW